MNFTLPLFGKNRNVSPKITLKSTPPKANMAGVPSLVLIAVAVRPKRGGTLFSSGVVRDKCQKQQQAAIRERA